jgi:hypothetical protein
MVLQTFESVKYKDKAGVLLEVPWKGAFQSSSS